MWHWASLNEVNLYVNISNYNRIAAKKISRFTNQLCFTAMEINFEILLNSRVLSSYFFNRYGEKSDFPLAV